MRYALLLISLLILAAAGIFWFRRSAPRPNILPGTENTISRAAAADLAVKLGVGQREIRVKGVEQVTWGDTSLGCPEQGKSYLQVLTEGFIVLLDFQDKEYEYHTGELQADGRLALVDCTDNPRNKGPLPES